MVSALILPRLFICLLLFELLKLPDVFEKMILTCSRDSGNDTQEI